MRRLSILLALFLTQSSLAATLTECQLIERRHRPLITIQDDFFSLCTYHIGKSEENVKSACESLALRLNKHAVLEFSTAISFCERAASKDERCERRSTIKQLCRDMTTFQRTL